MFATGCGVDDRTVTAGPDDELVAVPWLDDCPPELEASAEVVAPPVPVVVGLVVMKVVAEDSVEDPVVEDSVVEEPAEE